MSTTLLRTSRKHSERISNDEPYSVLLSAFPSPLGWMAFASRDRVLESLWFGYASRQEALRRLLRDYPEAEPNDATWPDLIERLQSYAAGTMVDFLDIAVNLAHLTLFERRVVERCRGIPWGQTKSYGQIGAEAGNRRAARAVGRVMARNRCPLVIPCHRVVRADGSVGEYSASAGRRTKLRLLEQEGALERLSVNGPGIAQF